MVNILARSQSFELQVWWELPPSSADVYPSKGDCKMVNQKWEKREEEDEGLTRASQSAWRIQGKGHHVGQNRRFEGTVEQGDRVRATCCRKRDGFWVRVWVLKIRANILGVIRGLHQKYILGWAGAAT